MIEAGVDEAGRGPIAGPVFAAAVILGKKHSISNLNDSKKISEKRRELIAEDIKVNAISWSIGMSTAKEIDEINILKNKLDSQSIENKKFKEKYNSLKFSKVVDEKLKKKAIFHIETIINEVDKCINKLEISE